jgi:fatty-acyl-CoA synthase
MGFHITSAINRQAFCQTSRPARAQAPRIPSLSNRPKAVPLIHCTTIENAFNIGERQGLVPGDRVFVSIPLFWSYGAVNVLPASVSHGAALVLQGHFDAEGRLDLIERHKCTAIYTLPAMTNALVGHPRFHPRRTATMRTGKLLWRKLKAMAAASEDTRDDNGA